MEKEPQRLQRYRAFGRACSQGNVSFPQIPFKAVFRTHSEL
jgi:hypothetical protein